jgi:hypothetical protein
MEYTFEELEQFERDKYLYKKFWNMPPTTKALQEQLKINHLIPIYGCDDPNLIFGECDVWNPDYETQSNP